MISGRFPVAAFFFVLFSLSSPIDASAQCGGNGQIACFNDQVCALPIPGGCVFNACWPETCALWTPDLTKPSCQPETGLEPIAGICQQCGADHQFACPSTGSCDTGTTNVLGYCLECSGPGQPACPDGTCDPWFNSIGMCVQY